MLERPIVAFDIETIPDPDIGRRVYGLEGDDLSVVHEMVRLRLQETEDRELGRHPFLPEPDFVGLHHPVGLAAVASVGLTQGHLPPAAHVAFQGPPQVGAEERQRQGVAAWTWGWGMFARSSLPGLWIPHGSLLDEDPRSLADRRRLDGPYGLPV